MWLGNTGLRPSDITIAKKHEVTDARVLVVYQRKTHRPVVCKLSQSTYAAVMALEPKSRELLLPWPMARGFMRTEFSKIIAAAGLTGTLYMLRKSSATAVEMVEHGAATAHLGHMTANLAARCYIDPRLVQQNKVLPPELPGVNGKGR